MPYLMPSLIRRVSPTQTDITWNDGHMSSYPSWYLRENCPCASCIEEFTGRRMVAHGSIPAGIARVDLEPVGNYALRFTWSDGHNMGIYSFDLLRSLCPCSECLPEGLSQPPEHITAPGSFEV